jgi:hypothetical protein
MRTLVDVQSVSPDRPRIVMEFEPRAACYRTPTLEANGNSLICVDRSREGQVLRHAPAELTAHENTKRVPV